jgi:hypothetical protein
MEVWRRGSRHTLDDVLWFMYELRKARHFVRRSISTRLNWIFFFLDIRLKFSTIGGARVVPRERSDKDTVVEHARGYCILKGAGTFTNMTPGFGMETLTGCVKKALVLWTQGWPRVQMSKLPGIAAWLHAILDLTHHACLSKLYRIPAAFLMFTARWEKLSPFRFERPLSGRGRPNETCRAPIGASPEGDYPSYARTAR